MALASLCLLLARGQYPAISCSSSGKTWYGQDVKEFADILPLGHLNVLSYDTNRGRWGVRTFMGMVWSKETLDPYPVSGIYTSETYVYAIFCNDRCAKTDFTYTFGPWSGGLRTETETCTAAHLCYCQNRRECATEQTTQTLTTLTQTQTQTTLTQTRTHTQTTLTQTQTTLTQTRTHTQTTLTQTQTTLTQTRTHTQTTLTPTTLTLTTVTQTRPSLTQTHTLTTLALTGDFTKRLSLAITSESTHATNTSVLSARKNRSSKTGVVVVLVLMLVIFAAVWKFRASRAEDAMEMERENARRHMERARGQNTQLENEVLSLRTNVSVDYLEPFSLDATYGAVGSPGDNALYGDGCSNPMYSETNFSSTVATDNNALYGDEFGNPMYSAVVENTTC
jgi:hypothetical protein